MAFNPFTERGKPIEEQWHPIQEIVVDPYDKEKVEEYSRLRTVWAYGMETAQWYFYHSLSRHYADNEIRALVAQIRRVEDQHRSRSTFFTDPRATIPQLTIAYEHLAVDLTAACAQNEPDPYVKQVFDYGLLEDFDHLHRFTLLLQRLEGKDAKDITKGLVEIKPGRATWEEHLHPMDTLRDFYDAKKADPLTRLHAMSILGAEQQTRQYYMGDAYWMNDKEARLLYAEIGQIEEQHVSQYEAIIDPRTNWIEMAIDHEYLEIYTYNGFLQEEKDPKMKEVWEEHLSDELEHLKLWNELYKKREGKEGPQLWPQKLPQPVVLKPAKEYVNQVLRSQVDLRPNVKQFVAKDQLPKDWASGPYRKTMEADKAPSTRFQGESEKRQAA